jgi:peptide chain release factor 1
VYGEVTLEVAGDDLTGLDAEAGGHRIQRIPPTERKGRIHTSTVTVAVMSPNNVKTVVRDSDLKVEWYSGSGAGGQHRNKVQCCCRLTHIPTGTMATAQTRSRQNSYKLARETIVERVESAAASKHKHETSMDRKQQMGSGMRGDKRRTYRFQDDMLKDHETGRSASCEQVLAGFFELLW